jgi:hypothetical protein
MGAKRGVIYLQICAGSQGEGEMGMNMNQQIMVAQVKRTARCKMYKTLMVIAMIMGMMQTAGAMAADWQVDYKYKLPSGSILKCYIDISNIVYLDNNKVRAWEKCGYENVKFLTEIDCKEKRIVLREARPIPTGKSLIDIGSKKAAESYNQDANIWKDMSNSDISNAQYNSFCINRPGR